MRQSFCEETFARERILARYIAPVASDLRLVDLQPLAQLMAGSPGNLSSIVESSCELYFKPDTLVFCRLGEIELDWSACPRVKLDMRFELRGVTAAFRLTLDAALAAVDLCYLTVETPTPTARHATALFERRLREARRSPAPVNPGKPDASPGTDTDRSASEGRR